MIANERASGSEQQGASPRVVLLAGPGDTTDIVTNWLDEHICQVTLITEEPQSRVQLTRRRIKRIGLVKTLGQVAFVAMAMPALQIRGRLRKNQILSESNLNNTDRRPDHHVDSVNSSETIKLLERLEPHVVVVNGTRIISARVLDSISCPVINTHAGLTPRYRGVHGGYWALAEGHPEEVGTTVHLVDSGIDTGRVLGESPLQLRRQPIPLSPIPTCTSLRDCPSLSTQFVRFLDGKQLALIDDDSSSVDSRLFTHPTLWGYLRLWATRGVR